VFTVETDPTLPPFLREWTPLEIDQLPLQVALLTMELAAIRQRLDRLATVLIALADSLKPPVF